VAVLLEFDWALFLGRRPKREGKQTEDEGIAKEGGGQAADGCNIEKRPIASA